MILQKSATGKAHLSPRAALLLLLLGQFLFLTVFSLLGHHAPPLDVIEIATWAVDPQLGYYKHPPLPAWVVWASEALFGRSRIALFLPAALSIVASMLALWPIATRMVGDRRALVAVFLQSTLLFYQLYASDYNHNVAQLPFWALAVTAFYFAVTEGRLRWWFAFGAALGVAALAKYSAAFLAPSCALLLAWDAQARRRLTPAALAVSLGGFLATFGPHLWWLAAHDFAPLRYLGERVGELSANASWSERFLSYVGGQLAAHVIALGVAACVWLRPGGAQHGNAGQGDDRFLLALGLGPFLTTLLPAFAGGYLHPMWAFAMFPLSGLLIVRALGARADVLYTRSWGVAWAVLMLGLGAVYVAKNSWVYPAVAQRYVRAAYPGPELARELEAVWGREVPKGALRTIVGTPWEAGIASFFTREASFVLPDADFGRAPWLDGAEIARCGAIAVWDPLSSFENSLRARFPQARLLGPLPVAPDRAGTYYVKVVHVAVIDPAVPCLPRK